MSDWCVPRVGFRAAVGWIAAAALVAGCIDGRIRDPDDAEPPSDAVSFDLEGRLVETDGAVRVGDGSHVCGFFPDTCPDGANCYSLVVDGELERRCLTFSFGEKGDDCTGRRLGECGDGLRCYQGTCRPICEPGGRPRFGCSSGNVCLRVAVANSDLPWGVCVRRTDECSLWPNDSCPAGQNCYPRRQGHRCRRYEEGGSVGGACDQSSDCGADQVCVERPGAESTGATCRAKCDDDHPCSSGTCERISDLEFGACFPRRDAG